LIPSILTTIYTVELIGFFIARHLESDTTVDLTNRRNRKTARSAIPVICRELIAQGHDPQERVHIVRKSMDRDALMPVFDRDRRSEKWAAIDVIENEERGPRTIHIARFLTPSSPRTRVARPRQEMPSGTLNDSPRRPKALR